MLLSCYPTAGRGNGADPSSLPSPRTLTAKTSSGDRGGFNHKKPIGTVQYAVRDCAAERMLYTVQYILNNIAATAAYEFTSTLYYCTILLLYTTSVLYCYVPRFLISGKNTSPWKKWRPRRETSVHPWKCTSPAIFLFTRWFCTQREQVWEKRHTRNINAPMPPLASLSLLLFTK